MSNENVTNLIDQISNKDFAGAQNTFNTVLKDKLTDALDAEKIKVSGEIYNEIDREELE